MQPQEGRRDSIILSLEIVKNQDEWKVAHAPVHPVSLSTDCRVDAVCAYCLQPPPLNLLSRRVFESSIPSGELLISPVCTEATSFPGDADHPMIRAKDYFSDQVGRSKSITNYYGDMTIRSLITLRNLPP